MKSLKIVTPTHLPLFHHSAANSDLKYVLNLTQSDLKYSTSIQPRKDFLDRGFQEALYILHQACNNTAEIS